MSTVIPISEVRNKLPQIVNLAANLSQKTLITVKGKVQAAIVNARDLELMEATLEILGDPKAMANIRSGQKDLKSGKLIDWKDIKEELGL